VDVKRTPLARKTALRKVSAKRRAYRASKEGQEALEHMGKVKMLPCIICAAPPPSDAHHCISGRYGTRKASDFEVISLCRACHLDGPNAIHRNKWAWEERNGPDHSYLPLVAEWLKKSPAG
jgi:hypothetical protein